MKKLLALNRGQDKVHPAGRRTRLKLRTVRSLSKEDRLSLHRFKADKAWLIGEGKRPGPAYLDID